MYATSRYEALLASQRIRGYVSLRGHLSDELREINFCRARLTDLAAQFAGDSGAQNAERSAPSAEVSAAGGPRSALHASGRGPGRDLFPPGCPTVEQAVAQFTETLTPNDLLDLDGEVQFLIRERFTALVHVCLTRANMVKSLALAMRETAEGFITARLSGLSIAAAGSEEEPPSTLVGAPLSACDLFLAQYPETTQAADALANAFEEASPELTSPRLPEETTFTVLAVPPGPAGDQLRTAARHALPTVELIPAGSQEDIVLYREQAYQPLCPREQLGETAEIAYRQMLATDNFTPHTRLDIHFDEG
jgi:hypothetical protein